MKSRIISFILCVILSLCCGCGQEKVKVNVPDNIKIGTEKKQQVVVAMNPSVALLDGTVTSVRKAVSDNISDDFKSKSNNFYKNSGWQWAYSTDEGFIQRTIRTIEPFNDGSGNKVSGTPYCYTVTDDKTSSLMPYDLSKVNISAYSDSIAEKGVLFTYTGKSEEALIYTFKEDTTTSFIDANGGNISLVKSISSENTDILSASKPVGVEVKLYFNNFLIWQEMLGNEALMGKETASVGFPAINGIEASAGDAIVLTFKTVDKIDKNFKGGYTAIPEKLSQRTKRVSVERERLIEGIYFLNQEGESTFSVVYPSNVSDEIRETCFSLKDRMAATVEDDFLAFKADNQKISSERMLLIGDTSYQESKKVMNELKATRSNNAADFIIRMVNGKLVIAALNKISLQLAVDYFMDNYCNDINASIPQNLNYVSSKHNKLKNITIAGKDIGDYRFVYSHTASYIETKSLEDLHDTLVIECGVDIKSVSDYEPAVPYEIVVGTNNRTSGNYNKLATTSVSDNYKISVSNGKLYISGEAYGVSAAIYDFIKELNKTSSYPNGYKRTGKYDNGYSLYDGYKLKFQDEFNGNKLSDYWCYADTTPAGADGSFTYVSENCAEVKDGALVQHLYSDEKGNYFGSRIGSRGNNPLYLAYGIMEIRVKYPVTKGMVFGFCGYGDNGFLDSDLMEFDVLENFGSNVSFSSTLHSWGKQHGQYGLVTYENIKYGTNEAEPLGYEYHTIGFEWDSNNIDILVDGKRVSHFDSSQPKYHCFDWPLYFQFAAFPEVGEYAEFDGGKVDDYSYIDYVRIYQKADNDSKITVSTR